MDTIDDGELRSAIQSSALLSKYQQPYDRETAYEILQNKVKYQQEHFRVEYGDKPAQSEVPYIETETAQDTDHNRKSSDENILTKASENTMFRQIGNTLLRETIRGVFGVLGFKRGRR